MVSFGLPRRGTGLGAIRWVVERTIARYHGMKRLRIQWERRNDIHAALLSLATCTITSDRSGNAVRTSKVPPQRNEVCDRGTDFARHQARLP
jgi:hypothetical protein